MFAAFLSTEVFAQKVQSVKADPAETSEKKSVLQKYIDISTTLSGETRKVFNDLSSIEKAEIFRLHLSLQLANRPSLTTGQKDLILDALAMVSDDFYDESTGKRMAGQQRAGVLAARAKGLFEQKDITDILANLGTTKENVVKLQKYRELSPFTMASRRQIFRESTASEKVEFWKIHVALYLAEHPDMNAYQNTFILSLFDFLTADRFDVSSETPEWEKKFGKSTLDLFQKGQQLFSKEEIVILMANLGGPAGTLGDIVFDRDCQCNRGDYDACLPSGCTGNLCNRKSWGCGIFFGFPCNGSQCGSY